MDKADFNNIKDGDDFSNNMMLVLDALSEMFPETGRVMNRSISELIASENIEGLPINMKTAATGTVLLLLAHELYKTQSKLEELRKSYVTMIGEKMDES